MKTCPNCDVPGVVTVTADVPVLPSDVAVMVAEPAVTPLTSPLPFTVATAVLLLDQVTTRPDNGLPFASLGVAITVTPEVPLLPSDVAVMVAEPAVTPLTSPLPPTVATDVLLLDHVTTRPVSTLPLASFRVAVSCTC